MRAPCIVGIFDHRWDLRASLHRWDLRRDLNAFGKAGESSKSNRRVSVDPDWDLRKRWTPPSFPVGIEIPVDLWHNRFPEPLRSGEEGRQ
ncbi:MAG: hypothetical protein D6812_17730 [Deltaproteobacteria bacterium]|nr:MAG: hypothetical protein D6812_17730 [Deltaproteobacteria bacterium]